MDAGQIGELIFKLYRVRFTEPGVGKYLKRWGLTFQRPDKRAVEQARKRSASGARRPGQRSGPRRSRTTVKSSSVTKSGSAQTRSPAVPGAPRGRRRWSAAPGTGSL
ncbi:helix-turn-helix domain-containing protein [Streptomyces aureoversilis]|uniref:helix-turn-helix domain-containing protein n=1 Tax=Streptomyces aureoversilis TaxID=67277 RepID=UPI003AA8743C